jgi:hypothetical protein
MHEQPTQSGHRLGYAGLALDPNQPPAYKGPVEQK